MLVKFGFQPGYMTYLDRSDSSAPVFWCYDHGFIQVSDNCIEIVKDVLENVD